MTLELEDQMIGCLHWDASTMYTFTWWALHYSLDGGFQDLRLHVVGKLIVHDFIMKENGWLPTPPQGANERLKFRMRLYALELTLS